MKVLLFVLIVGVFFGFFATVFERPIRKLMALVSGITGTSSNKGDK